MNPNNTDLGTQLDAVADELDQASEELRSAAERARTLEHVVRMRQPVLDRLKADVADLKRKQANEEPDE